MQPVQDITVDDRVSRTQFQYTLEDPNVDELHDVGARMLARLQQLPELRDVASDQQALGLRAQLVIDRETASRLGITPALHRSDALRLVRPASDLDDVHAAQSVPRRSSRSSRSFESIRSICATLFIRSGVATAPSRVAPTPAWSRAVSPSARPADRRSARRRRRRRQRAIGDGDAPATAFGGGPAASSIGFPNGNQVPLSALPQSSRRRRRSR